MGDSIERSDRILRVVMRIIELLYSLLVLGWIAAPLVPQTADYVPGLIPAPYLPFASFDGSAQSLPAAVALGIAVFLPGLIALFKLVATFLSKSAPAVSIPTRSGSLLLSVIQSALVIGALVYYLFEYARAPTFFYETSPVAYAVALSSVFYNALCLYRLVVNAGNRNEDYREYIAFKRGPGKAAMRKAGLTHGIQKKLVFSFLPLILTIIIVLSLSLMASFRTTILSSIIASGERLASQAADVIKSNPADDIAVDDYFLIEERKNELASFPFHELGYYARDPSTGNFSLSAKARRTVSARSSGTSDVGEAHDSGPVTARRLEEFTSPFHEFEADRDLYAFYAPVLLSNAYLGYVRVDYERDVIFEPYFRTLVRVVALASIFVYLGSFLIYLIGRNIVVPILYLRMSVASISASLSGMVKGNKRVSSEQLLYKDRVDTKDEIKGLSNEVGNMTTVIRGIVPYISASTLKHSERASPMNELRELCFLFTDIRGFTGMCEGLEPEEVVLLLNHYLELQSTIIIENGGDIDKFVGDQVMAVFEGPEKELHAAKTGIEIIRAMADERKKAMQSRGRIVSMGIGINSGEVVFGSIGAKDRMDFTSIGDAVNLAARLEGANKAYGTKALISELVYEKVKGIYLCREVDNLIVKGKSLPVSVYELIERRDAANANQHQLCSIFEQSLALYRKRSWDKAERGFTLLVEKYNDELSSTFLRRISHFRRYPPSEAWDGVFTMAVK